METTTLFDSSADLIEETIPLARTPYSGCLSIAFVGHSISCIMPRFIELDEIARPLSAPPIVEIEPTDRVVEEPEGVDTDFEPPLLAAGRFTAVARPGALPPLEWDY